MGLSETGPATPGFKTFAVVWVGQLVSILGSHMGSFALKVWVIRETGSVTSFALISFFYLLPSLLVSPLAGALVDRWDRRSVMIWSDSASGLGMMLTTALLVTGNLEIWHVYILMVVSSVANGFQWPAYAASMTGLVPKRHLGRANGMVSAADSSAVIASPVIAGALMAVAGIEWVLAIDLITYLFAVTTLAVVRFPRPKPGAASVAARGSLWRETAMGWTYIRDRPGLVALALTFAALNFFIGTADLLVAPLVLGFSSEKALGAVLSAGGLGMLAGSLVMSAWGGPRRRVFGILGFSILSGASIQLMGFRPSPLLVGAGFFMAFFCEPFLIGCAQTIWQTKVPADLQGRVFAVRRVIGWAPMLIAYLVAGPLTNSVGIGLLFTLLGIATLAVGVVGFAIPRLRRLDLELPDQVDDHS